MTFPVGAPNQVAPLAAEERHGVTGPQVAAAQRTTGPSASALHEPSVLAVASRAGVLATLRFRLLMRCQQSSLLPNRARRVLLTTAGLRMHPTAAIAHGCFVGGAGIRMGRHAYVNAGAFLDGSGDIVIGDYTRLGPLVRVITSAHRVRRSDVRRWPSDPTLAAPVTVQRGCWIGTGATLLPGVTVAQGCIVAAGSVVTRDTAPHGLYAGAPARRVRDLDVDEVFEDADCT